MRDALIDINTTIDTGSVNSIVFDTFSEEDRAGAVDARSPRLGFVLGSIAVLELLRELESQLPIARLPIAINSEGTIADIFDTLASLAAYVDEELR